jgi:hypothetical protein
MNCFRSKSEEPQPHYIYEHSLFKNLNIEFDNLAQAFSKIDINFFMNNWGALIIDLLSYAEMANVRKYIPKNSSIINLILLKNKLMKF